MSIPRDVKKAIELIRSRPERDLRLKKLAASCGVAPRTLQKHLKQFVGKTPGQLRFEARMDRARRQLLRAKPNVSVAEIATFCGITHLGRFASLYNKRFGETPSATLRRRAVHHIHGSEPRILPSRLDRPIICVHTFDCATRAPGPSGAISLKPSVPPSCAIAGSPWVRLITRDIICAVVRVAPDMR